MTPFVCYSLHLSSVAPFPPHCTISLYSFFPTSSYSLFIPSLTSYSIAFVIPPHSSLPHCTTAPHNRLPFLSVPFFLTYWSLLCLFFLLYLIQFPYNTPFTSLHSSLCHFFPIPPLLTHHIPIESATSSFLPFHCLSLNSLKPPPEVSISLAAVCVASLASKALHCKFKRVLYVWACFSAP